MFADRARILSAPEKAEMDMSASEENFMYQTAVRTAETAATAAI